MTRIAFVRHGRATGAENLCIGHTDVPLSSDGADSVRALLSGDRPRIARVVSSDLQRAAESATIIADSFGCAVQHDPRLREMHFGEWDGRAWSDIERNDAERFRDWMERWVDVAAPRGESATDVARRAADWLAETLPALDSPIVVVSHAGWIRAVLCQLIGSNLSRMFEIPVDYAHATIVDASPAGATIVAANVPTLGAIESRAAPGGPAYQLSL